MEYDVVVVGAGTAGCLAAKTAAEAGLKVCLVERKERKDIGHKICGDALGEHHLKNVGLEKPQHGELERRIEGVKIYSPDLETVFTVEHEDFSGYILNRHAFGQWLLNMCLDKGVDLFDSTQCLEPIISNNYVKGVLVKNMETEEKFHVNGKVIVDASGFLGVIRKKLPPEMNIENTILKEDVEACYREIRQLKSKDKEAEYCEIYLNQKVTPGGYTWIFPKSGTKVNVGLGVCMQEGFPNPKNRLYKHVLSSPVFEGSTLIDSGAWYDPTRRPLDNMVGNGVIVVGDAACLVNPIHGGGIGPSMLSGYLAGKVITEAIEEGDVSQNALWQYNVKYMECYGAKQASLDVFRMLLLTCKDEDLNYGMKYKLLTEEDVLKAGLGEEFRLNITETTKRIFRGIRRVRFLNRLRIAVNLMRKVKAHYRSYPAAPNKFKEWQAQTLALFSEAKSKLMAE
ncbi:MAG: NAD(P)/FAD-dependent oxidoreductase [Candidatus Bathyarchaeia archaeon]